VENHIIVFRDVTPRSLLEVYETFTGFRPISHGQHCRRRLVAQRQATSVLCPNVTSDVLSSSTLKMNA